MDTLTPAQVAERLHVTPRYVIDKAAAGHWPHLRIGPRTVRFTEDHITEIIRSAERTPAAKTNGRHRNRRFKELLNK